MKKINLKPHQIVVLHARIQRNLREYMQKCLKPYGLTTMEWAVLGLIKERQNEGISVSDVARLLKVKTALASVMISKQVKAGLLQKRSAKNDSRLRRVKLTETGLKRATTIEKAVEDQQQEWLKGAIGETDAQTYFRLISTLAKI